MITKVCVVLKLTEIYLFAEVFFIKQLDYELEISIA